jgi:hypothetical protein
MGKKTKIFLLSAFLVFVGALIADVIYSLRYRSKIHDGSEMFLCQAFELGDNVLNGYNSLDGEHLFIGIENVGPVVDSIEATVQLGSPTLQSVMAIVGETRPITYALDEFLLYLNHMNTILGDSTNNDVGNYECIFCQLCCSGNDESMVGKAISSISGSVASGLSEARVKVESALTGDNLDNVRSSLSSSDTTINDLKLQVESMFDVVLISNKDLFDSIVKYIDLATIIVIASMGLPTLLLLIVVFLGVFRSREKSLTNPSEKVRNPCCTSCSWCISFLFAFLIFIIAGVLGSASYLLASSCDLLVDIDTLVSDVVPRLSADSPSNSQVRDIIRTCATMDGSGDLLGTIQFADNKTARDALDISGPINAQFDKLGEMADGMTSSFAINPHIKSLIDTLVGMGSLFTMKPHVMEAIRSDPSFQLSPGLAAFLGDAVITDLIERSIKSVPDCNDRAASSFESTEAGEELASRMGVQGASLEGLSGFVAAVQAAGIDIGVIGNTCPAAFMSLSPPDVTMAHPFDKFVEYRTFVQSHTFRCDQLVVSPDPVSGAPSATINPRTCNWDDWVVYISDLGATLGQKALDIDSIQSTTMDRISTDLRSLVQEEVLSKVDSLLNGLDCKFINERYTKTIEALCWKEVPGMIGTAITWLVFACLCWVAIIIEFVIWRHLKDNLSLWYEYSKMGDRGSVMESQEGTMVATAEMQAGIGYPQYM